LLCRIFPIVHRTRIALSKVFMLELLSQPQVWIAFATLTALELVLGIDNIIFISILVDKVAVAKRELARKLGLFLALFMRLGLLLSLSWIVGLTAPLFSVGSMEFTGRMLILAGGGLFLVWKSIGEIREMFAGADDHTPANGKTTLTFASAIAQIAVIDMVFSLDSIITAVGMVDQLPVMVAAVITSVALMMLFAGGIGRFVSANPTIKMLALVFLVLVGVVLMAEGFGYHVPKGYVYSAMAFSLAVELMNIALRRRILTHSTPQELVSDAEEELEAAKRNLAFQFKQPE